MALTNKTNIRKRTVMDGLKKTFGKASQAISEKVNKLQHYNKICRRQYTFYIMVGPYICKLGFEQC